MRKKLLLKSGNYAVAILLIFMMAITPALTMMINAGGSSNYSYAVNISDVTGEAGNVSDKYLAKQNYSLYMPDDIVEVIIQLEESSLIDTYLDSYSRDYDSLAEYLSSDSGVNSHRALTNKQDTAKANISNSFNIDFAVSHTALLNGFTAKMRYGDVSSLKKNKYVKAVRISEYYSAPQTTVVENDVAMYDTGIYDSSTFGYDGEGTVVSILDTGLDYHHEAFTTMPRNPSLSKTDVESMIGQSTAWLYSYYYSNYSFFLEADDVYVNEKVPYAFNYANLMNYGGSDDLDAVAAALEVQPYEDHGTHVAGIIAGKSDKITGVAPEAQLVIMQIFDSLTGSATDSGILMAISDSVLLGVDTINMSLGAAGGFSEDAEDVWNLIYDSVTEVGVSLVVAAGNDGNSAENSAYGSTGLLSNPDTGVLGAPASYRASLSTASISGVKSQYLMANNSAALYIEQSTNGIYGNNKPNDFTKDILAGRTSAEYQYIKLQGVGRDNDYQGLNMTGKIALIPRGDTTFEDKARTAFDRGAIAAIIINNTSGGTGPYLGNFKGFPVCLISMDAGALLPETGSIQISTDYIAGPFMSSFSSWGVLPNLELKPDLTAHGGEVMSAIPGTDGNGNWKYDRYSGTSMAAPNLAGAMTLLRQHIKTEYPNLNAVEVTTFANQLMMSTASIVKNEENKPYSPRRQGAGLANLYYAKDTDAYLTVDGTDRVKLSVGDDVKKTGKYTLTFNVVNMSNTAKSYLVKTNTMTETVSSDGKTVAQKPYMLDKGSVSLSSSSSGLRVNGGNWISVAGGGSGQLTVTVTLSTDEKTYLNDNFVNGMFVEGYVELIPQFDNGIELSIPWTGFYGDWTKAPIFDLTVFDVAASKKDQSVNEDDKAKAVMTETRILGLYSSNGNGSLVPLGEYPFMLDDESKKPAADADKIALSSASNGYGNYSIYALLMGSLRGAKKMDVDVTNTITGKSVFSETYQNIRKAYSNGSSAVSSYITPYITPSELGLANNTKYNVNISASLDWKGEQNNEKDSFAFDFYMDTDSPVLLQERTTLRVEERNNKKRYYLDLYVYDNHYVETMILGTYKDNLNNLTALSDDLINPLETRRNDVTKITREITDKWNDLLKNDEKIYVEFMDCARNPSQYIITLPRVQPDTIAFSKSEIDIRTNETIDLKSYLSVIPEDTWKFNLDWKVSSPSVRVHDGEIMGVTATDEPVTVTVTANGIYKASIKVNVIEDASLTAPVITGFRLSETSRKVSISSSGTLTATPIPWNARLDNIDIVWYTRSEFIEFKVSNDKLSVDYTITGALNTVGTNGFIRVTVDNRASVYADCNFTIAEEFKIEGTTITEYNGSGDKDGVVTIPKGLGVSHIGSAAFANKYEIKKVVIEEEILEISDSAFYRCPKLTVVVLPTSVKTIGFSAFGECESLAVINLGNVETIGYQAFAGLNIEVLDLKSAQYIGFQAFTSNTSVKELNLSNCRYMGESAFAYSDKIQSITTSERTMIGVKAFLGCTNIRSLNLNSRNIGTGAFAGCYFLASVTINNDIYKMGEGVFVSCTVLKSVVFRGTMKSIPASTFENCTALETIRLPMGLQTIGSGAFESCTSLQRITIPANAQLQSVGFNCFSNTPSTLGFEIEEGNPYIQGGDISGGLYRTIFTYGGAKLIAALPVFTAYTVSGNLKIIGEEAFSGHKKLTTLTLAGNNDIILEAGAFESSGITTIIIANTANKGISNIGSAALANTPLVIFPGQSTPVEYIGDGAFYGCKKFTGFDGTDLSRVYYLGHEAFYNCAALTEIDLQNMKIDAININTFYSTGLTIITIPDSVKVIDQYAFGYCYDLVSVDLPKSLEKINAAAFMGCSALATVSVPETVKLIDHSAFYACKMLSSVNTIYYDFDGNTTKKSGFTEVLEFGNAVFYGTALTEFYADKATTVGSNLFSINTTYNTSLKTVSLPKAITLSDKAFYGCQALSSVYIPRVESIGVSAFQYNTALIAIEMPSVIEIGEFAFESSTGLYYVDAPKAETLGAMAFSNTSLTTLKAESLRYIGTYAFAITPIRLLYLPASLETIDEGAFAYMPNMSRFEVDPANKNFFSEDGVLYSVLSGGYQLEAYPMSKSNTSYTVKEGTLRIASEAVHYNSYLQEVTLPWSLRTIGDAAFYSCPNLLVYRFKSYEAPILETYYQKGYVFLYINFSTYIGNVSIIMERPENGLGYNDFIYDWYFQTEYVGAKVADYVTMSAIKAIDAIDVITADSKSIIEYARSAYDSVTPEQKALVTNYGKLLDAESRLAALLNPPVNKAWLSGILISAGALILVIVIVIGGSLLRKKKKPASEETL